MMDTKQENNYRKFLEGTFLVKGWKTRSEEILQAVPEKDRNRIKAILQNLGEKIGSEWSRDKSVRKIDTSRLQKWGRELQDAKKESPQTLVKRIEELDREVAEILS